MNERTVPFSFIPHSLFRFNRMMMKNAPETEGLNHSQRRTLMLLRHAGSQPMSGIVRHMNIEKGSMTAVIDSLIEKGLVQRERDINDRRRVIISLTAEGIRKGATLEIELNAYVEDRLASLGPEKKKAVLEAVELFKNCVETWEKNDG